MRAVAPQSAPVIKYPRHDFMRKSIKTASETEPANIATYVSHMPVHGGSARVIVMRKAAHTATLRPSKTRPTRNQTAIAPDWARRFTM